MQVTLNQKDLRRLILASPIGYAFCGNGCAENFDGTVAFIYKDGELSVIVTDGPIDETANAPEPKKQTSTSSSSLGKVTESTKEEPVAEQPKPVTKGGLFGKKVEEPAAETVNAEVPEIGDTDLDNGGGLGEEMAATEATEYQEPKKKEEPTKEETPAEPAEKKPARPSLFANINRK